MMKTILTAVAVFSLLAKAALAGPNAGGTILVHNPQLTYPGPGQGFSACGMGTPPASCESANTRIDDGDNQYVVWKVYAAFVPCTSPRLKAMEFGITYDPSVVLVDRGNCLGDPNGGHQELPGPGWPSSGSSDVLIWQYTQTTTLVEAYWFAGYTENGEPGEFRLTASQYGGMFADDSNPPQNDAIAGYGALGFNEPGSAVCPPSASLGACCIGPTCTIACESDCEGHGGNYLGEGTTCDPPGVCGAVPTSSATWGRIKQRYR